MAKIEKEFMDIEGIFWFLKSQDDITLSTYLNENRYRCKKEVD